MSRPKSVKELKKIIKKPLGIKPRIRFTPKRTFSGDVRFQMVKKGPVTSKAKINLCVSLLYPLIETYIHEKIHLLHPQMDEQDVLFYEKRLMNVLNIKEMSNLLKEIASLLNNRRG